MPGFKVPVYMYLQYFNSSLEVQLMLQRDCLRQPNYLTLDLHENRRFQPLNGTQTDKPQLRAPSLLHTTTPASLHAQQFSPSLWVSYWEVPNTAPTCTLA